MTGMFIAIGVIIIAILYLLRALFKVGDRRCPGGRAVGQPTPQTRREGERSGGAEKNLPPD